MKRVALVVALALLVAAAAAWRWRARTPPAVADGERAAVKNVPAPKPDPAPIPLPPNPSAQGQYDLDKRLQLLGEAKTALLGKIAKDYEEMLNETAAKFAQQGSAFPGGFSAYLKQLALLERSKWDDYAKVLTPREFEDLQMLEHHAGKLVSLYLGDTPATDEQKRAVFRLQRDFDDKYALIFDLTTPGVLSREIERQALQEKIYAVLGDNLFAPWLRGEMADYDQLVQYTRQSGIRPEAPIEVWRIKNEFLRRRLEINAQGAVPAATQAAQAVLAEQTRARIAVLLGPASLASPAAAGLGWLPPK
jgi:hypothetical protein